MSITEILHKMQKELKAPKGQYNNFGKYKYRSCEDVVEAVKEVLPEGCYLSMADEVQNIGDRFYVKATATLVGSDGQVGAIAYAREPDAIKGMGESQITGTASSYARKYALNGLFAIDDTKDADTNEHKIEIDNDVREDATARFILSINEKLDKVESLKELETCLTDKEKNDWKKLPKEQSALLNKRYKQLQELFEEQENGF